MGIVRPYKAGNKKRGMDNTPSLETLLSVVRQGFLNTIKWYGEISPERGWNILLGGGLLGVGNLMRCDFDHSSLI